MRGAQVRQQRLGEKQRRLQIAAHEIVPLLLGDGTERGRIEIRSVVDQHVETARALDDVSRHPLERTHVAHVRGDAESRAAALALEVRDEIAGRVAEL